MHQGRGGSYSVGFGIARAVWYLVPTMGWWAEKVMNFGDDIKPISYTVQVSWTIPSAMPLGEYSACIFIQSPIGPHMTIDPNDYIVHKWESNVFKVVSW